VPFLVAAVLFLFLSLSGIAQAQSQKPRPPPSATGIATVVRVRPVEPQRVLRCTDAPMPAEAAPRKSPPEVAVAAAAGTPPAGTDPRSVATAAAAAVIAVDAVQQARSAPSGKAAQRCTPVLVPPVTQWRVEYFLAGRYRQAWFDRPPGPAVTLADLLRATPAEER
jgi:hypothetical protein